jgi:acyl-CoA reductase-like NAD-dependent aldehyde dehydrogenase
MTDSVLNFIDGEWCASRTNRVGDRENPANKKDIVARAPRSDAEDAGRAVAAAKRAFASWRLVPGPRRGQMIAEAGRILADRKESVARLMSREMGKPIAEARGDVQEAIDTAILVSAEGRRIAGETTQCELPDKFGMSIRQPVGVAGIITPWNFPVAIPSWKIFPALVCGNTVVLKPAELTSACAAEFVKALDEAGIPKGVVNLVCGAGREVGSALVSNPDVRLVSFTGSTEVGKSIGEACGRMNKKVTLEMGGKNAQVVMEDADLDLALDGALWGAFGTAGQRCTATSRLILHRPIADTFVAKLRERAAKLVIGDPVDEKTQVGPVVSESQRNKVREYFEIGKKDGATLILGGGTPSDPKLADGWFLQPTIFTNVKPGMRIAQEEIFGPVLSVITVDTFEEATTVLNGTEYGLSSSIYTRDVNRAFRAIRDFEAGITYVNGPTIGAEVQLPFGGVKGTGNGHREAGTQVYEFYTEWKSVYVDYSGKLQRAQIDV